MSSTTSMMRWQTPKRKRLFLTWKNCLPIQAYNDNTLLLLERNTTNNHSNFLRRIRNHSCHHLRIRFGERRFLYQDATLSWAKETPQLAEHCLRPPPLSTVEWRNHYVTTTLPRTLEEYCEWRKWPLVSNTTTSAKTTATDDPVQVRKRALALCSHVLSAPLTLAVFFADIATLATNDKKLIVDEQQQPSLRWNHHPSRFCCVGARAEALLPLEFWKEFLLFGSALITSKLYNEESSTSVSPIEFIKVAMDFVGPDIPQPKTFTNSKQTSTTIVDLENGSKMSLRWYYKGLLHEIMTTQHHNHHAPNMKEAIEWDTFVLFNPGFGHENLRDSWHPTLQLILQQNVLLESQDPFDKEHFVRPNHYVAHLV